MRRARLMSSRRRSPLCFKTKLVRLRYQDGSNMAEHMNAFQGLINQAMSLDVPLVGISVPPDGMFGPGEEDRVRTG